MEEKELLRDGKRAWGRAYMYKNHVRVVVKAFYFAIFGKECADLPHIPAEKMSGNKRNRSFITRALVFMV